MTFTATFNQSLDFRQPVTRQSFWKKLWTLMINDKDFQISLLVIFLLNLSLIVAQGWRALFRGTFPEIEVLDSFEEIFLRKSIVTVVLIEVYIIQAEWYFWEAYTDLFLYLIFGIRRDS